MCKNGAYLCLSGEGQKVIDALVQPGEVTYLSQSKHRDKQQHRHASRRNNSNAGIFEEELTP